MATVRSWYNCWTKRCEASLDGEPECSVADERYISDCTGMPPPYGTLLEGAWQCEVGGYLYNAGTNHGGYVNHGALFGVGYQTYLPAKTDDPAGVNYQPGQSAAGMEHLRTNCPLSCNACPTSAPTMAKKDPHLWFAHGGRADFRGEDGAVYNLLSAKDFALNVGIKYADFHMKHALVHGSAMDAVYVVARTTSGSILKVQFNATATEHHVAATVQHGATSTKVGAGKAFDLDGHHISVSDRALTVSTPKWTLRAASAAFPYASKNPGKVLLDVTLTPAQGYVPDNDIVAPHGIIGQSYDGDNVGINGAIDAAAETTKEAEMTTHAQAEGAIEGAITDYKMQAPFATEFAYSRFDAISASRRDPKKLTGKRVTVAIPHMSGADSVVEESA